MAVSRLSFGPMTPRKPPKGATRTAKGKVRLPLKSVRELDLANRALELRVAGHTYKQIAQRLSAETGERVTDGRVFALIQQEITDLRARTELNAEAVRDIENERCDALLRGLTKRIAKGEPAAVQAAVKVLERRAKLNGLDAPTKVAMTLPAITPENAATMTSTDIEAKLEQLRLRVRGETVPRQLSPAPPDIDVLAVQVEPDVDEGGPR